MTIVKLKNLKAGMVLASNIKDLNGSILLKTGSAITEKHIKIFRSWGITEADIKDKTKENTEAIVSQNLNSEILAKAESEVIYLFRHANHSHPVIKELYNLCILKKTQPKSWKKAKNGKKKS